MAEQLSLISVAQRLRQQDQSEYGIELLSAREVTEYLQEITAEHGKHGLRTNNQLVELVQLPVHWMEAEI